jgi:hypothetical protein
MLLEDAVQACVRWARAEGAEVNADVRGRTLVALEATSSAQHPHLVIAVPKHLLLTAVRPHSPDAAWVCGESRGVHRRSKRCRKVPVEARTAALNQPRASRRRREKGCSGKRSRAWRRKGWTSWAC